MLVRMIVCYKIEETVKEMEENKSYLNTDKQEELVKMKRAVTFLSTNFQEKEFTIENIFNQSLNFFVIWAVSWGGVLVIEPVVRSLLALNRPANGYDY